LECGPEYDGDFGVLESLVSLDSPFFAEEHKMVRRAVSLQLLRRYAVEGDGFLFNILTGDESWFHHFDLETKRQPWNSITPHRQKKKQKTIPSAGKVLGSFFWDTEGYIVIDCLEKRETINAARYVQTFSKLRRVRREKRPKKKTVILQHDNARPHTVRLTLQTIQRTAGNCSPIHQTVRIWLPQTITCSGP
jgi:hypothetical protein